MSTILALGMLVLLGWVLLGLLGCDGGGSKISITAPTTVECHETAGPVVTVAPVVDVNCPNRNPVSNPPPVVVAPAPPVVVAPPGSQPVGG